MGTTNKNGVTVSYDSIIPIYIKASAKDRDKTLEVKLDTREWRLEISRIPGTTLSIGPGDRDIIELIGQPFIKLYKSVMGEYERLSKIPKSSKKLKDRTIIFCQGSYLIVQRADMQKYIAEAETPLELTRFGCTITWYYRNISFNFTPGNYEIVPAETNINDIIPEQLWQEIRAIAKAEYESSKPAEKKPETTTTSA